MKNITTNKLVEILTTAIIILMIKIIIELVRIRENIEDIKEKEQKRIAQK